MERKIIYLEIDEEIISVIDKIKKASETEVHLVVPKEAALLQSVVNLKLLRRQADNLKKSIHIITHDKVGRNLAEQVGIESATNIKDIPEKPEEGPESEKLKNEPAQEIEYKEKESPLAETKEVVFDKGSIVESEEEAKKEIQVGSGQSEDGAEPEMIIRGGETGPEEKSEGHKEVSGTPEKLIPKFPIKKFALIFGIILLFLAGFLFFYLPLTKVDIKLATEKQNKEVLVTIDKSTDKKNASSAIVPASDIVVEKTITKTYQSTGTKNIGNKAQGTVTVQNAYSTLTQTLVAGTRFETSNLIFISQSDVDVPGYTDTGGGSITPGTATVSVIAESAGETYNIATSTFHIPAFAGTSRYDKITAVSTSAMTGGSTKEVKIVSADDISQAKSTFSTEAETEIKNEGQSKKKEGQTIDAKAEKITVGALNASQNAGAQADSFTISTNVKYQAIAFSRDDLNQVVYDNLKSKTVPNKAILETALTSVNFSFDQVDFDKGQIVGQAKTTIHLGTKIDTNLLKEEIIGNNSDQAKNYLSNLEGVDSATIEFWPSFWQYVTRIKSHIYVKTEFVESE